jgi:hypothetical protein
MKKLWFGIAICLIVILIIYLFGKPFVFSPKLVIPEETWDFGKVKTGVFKHTFLIQNTGRAELTLVVYPNCPRCIRLKLEKPSIPPKGAAKLEVEIYAKAEGPYEAYAMIESNDPKNRVKKLMVKGMVANQ